ncbi:MAG: hypothetical protein HY608_02710 [Planctomycetes bacterium]|nr:hypothetical protein [Planctomycetota bacterium]
MNPPLLSLLEKLVGILDREQIPYLVMGGIAVRFWGLPRPTYDLDLTLSIPPGQVPAFCRRLEAEGFTVPEVHARGFVDTLAGMRKIGVLHHDGTREIRVDLFLVTTPYQEAAFGRRLRKRLDGMEAWIPTPEDLILHKLIAGRDRDLADISDVLVLNPDVDRTYLEKWAQALGAADLLARKLRESDAG